jgi:hypothetical protein
MQLALSTRLAIAGLVFLLALLPLALGVYINETSSAPTEKRLPTRCSRYCEAHNCPHATPSNSPAYFQLRPLYNATVQGLSMGGMRLYALVNIGFYLVLVPLLLLWLTYGALRNMVLIHHLKAQRRG